jgi:RNA polymerase sigma factor (sigma-70 family)
VIAWGRELLAGLRTIACADTKSVFGRERSDAAIIGDSLGRPEAFEAIFDRHFDAVQRYLARRAGTSRADDLASATFAVAFERRRGFRAAASSARPWLFGIATNLLRNELRTEQRSLSAIGRVASEAGRGDADAAMLEPPDLPALLAVLDADQRDVLLLYAWEGLSYREIAVALGVPVGTIRSRLARARVRLRAELGGRRDAARTDRQEVTE